MSAWRGISCHSLVFWTSCSLCLLGGCFATVLPGEVGVSLFLRCSFTFEEKEADSLVTLPQVTAVSQ